MVKGRRKRKYKLGPRISMLLPDKLKMSVGGRGKRRKKGRTGGL
jgi:hypothetical protein